MCKMKLFLISLDRVNKRTGKQDGIEEIFVK